MRPDPGAMDDGARALAERWISLARSQARFYARRWPHLADEFESECLFVLVLAAISYPGSAAAARGANFCGYLKWRLMRDGRAVVLMRERPRGLKKPRSRATPGPATIPLAEAVEPASPRRLPEAEAESAEGFEALVRLAPAEYRAALVDHFRDTGYREVPVHPTTRAHVRRALVALRASLDPQGIRPGPILTNIKAKVPATGRSSPSRRPRADAFPGASR